MVRPKKLTKKWFVFLFVAGGIVALTVVGLSALRRDAVPTNMTTTAIIAATQQTNTRAQENFGKLPLYFVENRGQMDARVAYYAQGRDKTIYFTEQGLTFVLNNPSPQPQTTRLEPASLRSEAAQTRYTLKLEFVQARADLRPVGREQTEAVFSYFKGAREQWQAGLKSYAQVVYENVWPGIDLIYAGTVNRMKYSFIVRPGADPNQIRLAWRGATGLAINPDGGLEVQTPAGGFTDERPVSRQEQDEVATSFHVNEQSGRWEFGFRLGEYDRSQELIIDPVVLVYCGFIGGSGADRGNDIAVDSAGNAYVTGATNSAPLQGFPVTVGPDLTHNGSNDTDVFVAKVRADGTGLLYCGYLGGSFEDAGTGVAVDDFGNAYLVGDTLSTEAQGFPVIVGPDLTYNRGNPDVFVAKVTADGTALAYCGYLGGSGNDFSGGIAVDGLGQAYVTGLTSSTEQQGFPVAIGPDTTHNGGGFDGFVARVNAGGTGLDYCGYLGGSALDRGQGIAVDRLGNAFVTGNTMSAETQGFPVTVGPDLSFNGGPDDAFIAKVKADGTGLLYCGYVGGSAFETGMGVALDHAGNAYLTGFTASSETQGFPVQVGPDLTFNGGGLDGFVTRVNAGGTGLDYCGYLGGSASDRGQGIAVNRLGNAFVTGWTLSSNSAGFPVTVGPDLNANTATGNSDAFVAQVQASGLGLEFCRYLGSTATDMGNGIAVDMLGAVYVTGNTESGMGFPVIVGPDTMPNGGMDAFVAKFSENQSPIAKCHNVTVTSGANCTANATIDNGSFDPDGDQITLSQTPPGPYPRGTTSVTLRATDSYGATSECTANVTVVDKTRPTITHLSASPAVLWPPNHKLVYVTVNYTATDNCDASAALHCQLSVKSNEPVNGTGDGDTAPDWIVMDAHHVWLRAERDGKGNGRVYTITVTCTDQSGNSKQVCTTVKVPKSQGQR